jgi:hypothetical protein
MADDCLDDQVILSISDEPIQGLIHICLSDPALAALPPNDPRKINPSDKKLVTRD